MDNMQIEKYIKTRTSVCNINYTQAGVSCFVRQERGKLEVKCLKALPAYS